VGDHKKHLSYCHCKNYKLQRNSAQNRFLKLWWYSRQLLQQVQVFKKRWSIRTTDDVMFLRPVLKKYHEAMNSVDNRRIHSSQLSPRRPGWQIHAGVDPEFMLPIHVLLPGHREQCSNVPPSSAARYSLDGPTWRSYSCTETHHLQLSRLWTIQGLSTHFPVHHNQVVDSVMS